MIKIKIKGKITPYTPKYSQRIIARKDIPLSDNKLCCIDSIYQPDTQTREKVIYVNGRKCRMQHHWETFYAICPVDEPLPPRKPRISEQEADNIYMQFCKTNNWCDLFWAWERCGRELFRIRLLHRMVGYSGKKNCDICELRFQCFTEKISE